MRARPLPDGLGAAFTVAEARRAGVPPSRLRARDLERPFYAVRARAGIAAPEGARRRLGEERVLEAALQYLPRMGAESFYCGATAGVGWGLPLDASLLRDGVDVGAFWPHRAPEGRNVRGRSVRPELASVRMHPVHGFRITSPASTWAMLAAEVRDLRDLVALGDAVVREPMFADDPPPLATLDQLRAAVHAGRRVGAARLREALPLVRTRSASRRETWCRLALLAAGLDEPELNHVVRDADGILIACVGLAYPRERVAIEYEGEHHLTDPVQWARDIDRHARLVELGWIVIRVTKQQAASPGHLAARVARALAARR